jgi:hypothetical protein
MTFNSLEVAPLRSVCWDKSSHVILFPPFSQYPDLHAIARTDLKEWVFPTTPVAHRVPGADSATLPARYVSTGNSLVFLGGFATIGLMNDIFGFRLSAEVYQVLLD